MFVLVTEIRLEAVAGAVGFVLIDVTECKTVSRQLKGNIIKHLRCSAIEIVFRSSTPLRESSLEEFVTHGNAIGDDRLVAGHDAARISVPWSAVEAIAAGDACEIQTQFDRSGLDQLSQ
jgi:hypothetical protein